MPGVSQQAQSTPAVTPAAPQPDPHPQDAHIRRPRSRAPQGGLTESNLRTQARFR